MGKSAMRQEEVPEGGFSSRRLARACFTGDTPEVARRLLGARLVRQDSGGRRIAGIILETEAYRGETDLACHARSGRTARNEAMYGPPGHAYVYFTYGMHWLLNCVTGPLGFPAAVLIRAVLPTEGLDVIGQRRRGRRQRHWTDGPAKLCQAFGIDGRLNGADLCAPEAELFLEPGMEIADWQVAAGPRVGLNTVPEPWKSIPWRFLAELDG